jgi:hypothetical protein
MIAALALVTIAVQTPELRYETPAGWTRTVDPRTAVTTLMPGRLPPGQVAVITVFSPEPFAGTAAEYHAEITRRAIASGRLLEPPDSSSTGDVGGGATRSATRHHVVMPNGAELWITIYTVRWGTQAQAFLLTANSAEMAERHGPAADAMIAGITAPSAEPARTPPVALNQPARSPQPPCYRPTGIEMCPQAVVADDPATRIVGAWIAAAARSRFTPGAGVRSGVTTEILLLFANGVAARSAAIRSGGDTYWAEGFATMDPRDPAQIGARRVGRWSEHNGTITIAWQIGAPQTLARDGRSLREQYTTWQPYPPVDGLRLDGRYQRIEEYATPWSLTLRGDGRFEASGLHNAMGGTAVNPGFPERGAGTYEIAKWSLILRFDNGFVQSMNLMVGENELVINGYPMKRS